MNLSNLNSSKLNDAAQHESQAQNHFVTKNDENLKTQDQNKPIVKNIANDHTKVALNSKRHEDHVGEGGVNFNTNEKENMKNTLDKNLLSSQRLIESKQTQPDTSQITKTKQSNQSELTQKLGLSPAHTL